MKNVTEVKDMNLINFYNPNEIKICSDFNKIYKFINVDQNYESTVFKEVHDVQLNGFIPIILYPEKLIPIINDINNINDFLDSNCLFMLDAKSLKGDYGRAVKNLAKTLLENKIYNFINKNRVSKNDIDKIISKYEGCSEFMGQNIKKLNNGEIIDFNRRRIKFRKKILGIF